MDLVNPNEKEQLRKCVIERIGPDVADLFVSEVERILKEIYSVSPEDLIRGQVLSDPDLL
jgi:hypothetical protein